MGIFEKVSETISSTSRDMANKARTVADVSKLKHQIFIEEEKIKDIYTELGKKYYKDNGSNPAEKYAPFCDEAYITKARIEKLKQQIYSIKGIKVCEKCGAEVDEEYQFCGICGAKLPEVIVEVVPVEADFVEEDESIEDENDSIIE